MVYLWEVCTVKAVTSSVDGPEMTEVSVFVDASCWVGEDALSAMTNVSLYAMMVYGTGTDRDVMSDEHDPGVRDSTAPFGGTFGMMNSCVNECARESIC